MAAGSKPGERRGGRKKGTPNKASAARAAAVAASGLTPLDYMLKVMRGKDTDDARRDDMAKAAAPYVHQRLAATEHRVHLDLSKYTDEQLAELDRVRSLVALAGGDQGGDTAARGAAEPQDNGTKH